MLRGELGTGKTTLVKGIAQALDAAEPDEVTSPTFTLIHEYDGTYAGKAIKLFHIDVYRLESERQLETLGLDELLTPDALVLVEWGDKFKAIKKRATGEIAISSEGGDARKITVTLKESAASCVSIAQDFVILSGAQRRRKICGCFLRHFPIPHGHFLQRRSRCHLQRLMRTSAHLLAYGCMAPVRNHRLDARECTLSLIAAAQAHSVALLAFGSDSLIELLSASVVLLQFLPRFPLRRTHAERAAAVLLYLFAAAVVVIALLSYRRAMEISRLGIGITAAALVAMPVLAWLKRRHARAVNDRALAADAVQSATCAYLAAVTLAGLATFALWHIAWVDSVAALAALPVLIIEGRRAWRGEPAAAPRDIDPRRTIGAPLR